MEPRFESVHSDSDSSLRCAHVKCESFANDHSWHYHPEYELTWIMRSEGSRFIGDSVQRYAENDLVLIGPNLPHCWRNEPRAASSAEPELIVAQFRRDCCGSDFLSLAEAAPLRRLLDLATSGVHFTGPVVDRVAKLLQDMSEVSAMMRLVRLMEVLDLLASCSSYSTLATGNYLENCDISPVNRCRMDIVQRYVRKNLGGEVSQAHIAGALGLTPPAFSRFFRAATGKTFVQYVNTLRVNSACQLLSSSSLSVTEIAMECGYQTISNFNRQFRTVRGINPSDYRQRQKMRA